MNFDSPRQISNPCVQKGKVVEGLRTRHQAADLILSQYGGVRRPISICKYPTEHRP